MSHGCTNTGAPSEAQWARNVTSPSSSRSRSPTWLPICTPFMPACEAALQLTARQIGVLQRHLPDRHQPAVPRRAQLEQGVVEDAGTLHRLLRRAAVGEQHGRRRDDLDVDAIAVHVGEAHWGVPARRRHGTELTVAEHHRRSVARRRAASTASPTRRSARSGRATSPGRSGCAGRRSPYASHVADASE